MEEWERAEAGAFTELERQEWLRNHPEAAARLADFNETLQGIPPALIIPAEVDGFYKNIVKIVYLAKSQEAVKRIDEVNDELGHFIDGEKARINREKEEADREEAEALEVLAALATAREEEAKEE